MRISEPQDLARRHGPRIIFAQGCKNGKRASSQRVVDKASDGGVTQSLGKGCDSHPLQVKFLLLRCFEFGAHGYI